jgi:protoheme IX farnesyltransferase
MSTTAREAERTPWLVSDYLALLKLRIASFVGLSAFVGGLLAAAPGVPLVHIAEAAVWVTLAAGAASVFNQVLERDSDRLMERTRNRPLPSGRIGLRDALLYGTALATLSIGALGFRFNVLAAALALATLFAYVAVYTPLKRLSTLNTVIGALPGAAPPLIGYAALSGDVRGWAWALFAILFVWQFPHFMAIAWLYRHDYARAGLRMLPVELGGERIAGKAALWYGLVLLPVSQVPAVWGDAGVVFCAGSMALGLVYCAAALRFAWRQDRAGARMLLFVSLAYLPLVLLLVVLDPVTGVAAAHLGR